MTGPTITMLHIYPSPRKVESEWLRDPRAAPPVLCHPASASLRLGFPNSIDENLVAWALSASYKKSRGNKVSSFGTICQNSIVGKEGRENLEVYT